MQAFARKLEGCDAADVRVLADRALHASLSRRLASPSQQPASGIPHAIQPLAFQP
jgi:anti-sigma factor RsiW